MTKEAPATTPKKGCGPILVTMIALFFLTMGLLSGAGGLYAYLYASDDGVERLRLAPPETAAEATPEQPQEQVALAYPLLETLQIDDDLDESEIRNRISNERGLLEECYMAELERSPDTRGEIDLQFTVNGSSGDVVAAVTRNNHTGSEDLSDCILAKIRKDWSFSAPDTSGVATVRFHTLFLPLNDV